MRSRRTWVYVGMSLMLENGEATYNAIAGACRAHGVGTDRSFSLPWSSAIGPDIRVLIDEANAGVFDLTGEAASVYAELARAESAGQHLGRVLLVARPGVHLRGHIDPSRVKLYRTPEELASIVRIWLAAAIRLASAAAEPPGAAEPASVGWTPLRVRLNAAEAVKPRGQPARAEGGCGGPAGAALRWR